MNFLDKLRKDKMEAMREKDRVRGGVLSLMMSAILLAEKEKHTPLTEEEALRYVAREAKQTRDALEMTPESRSDLREELEKKLEIIESYLPKQMTEAEIHAAILEIVEEKGLELSPKARGLIMKEMMAKYSGKTDGKMVTTVLSSML